MKDRSLRFMKLSEVPRWVMLSTLGRPFIRELSLSSFITHSGANDEKNLVAQAAKMEFAFLLPCMMTLLYL